MYRGERINWWQYAWRSQGIQDGIAENLTSHRTEKIWKQDVRCNRIACILTVDKSSADGEKVRKRTTKIAQMLYLYEITTLYIYVTHRHKDSVVSKLRYILYVVLD